MTWRFTWKPAWITESLRQVPNGFRYRGWNGKCLQQKEGKNHSYWGLLRYVLIPNSESVGFQSLGAGSGDAKMHARKNRKNRNSPGTLLEPCSQPCWNLAGSLLEDCWNCAGTFLEPFGTFLEPVLEPCWNLACSLAGTLLDRCWKIAGTVLEPSWNHLEPSWNLCWNLAGTFLGTLSDLCWNRARGNFLERSWTFAGTSLEPCWNFCVSTLVTVWCPVVILSPKTHF